MSKVLIVFLCFAMPMLANVFGSIDFNELLTCSYAINGVTGQGCISPVNTVSASGSNSLTGNVSYSGGNIFFSGSDNNSYTVNVLPPGINASLTWGFGSSSTAISQEVVITGGSGTGYIGGVVSNVFSDCYPYALCPGGGNAVLSVPSSFVFGVPFTISLYASLTGGAGGPTTSSPETSIQGGGGSGYDEMWTIVDSNGNPVSNAVLTEVPEPSFFLPILALAGWAIPSQFRRRTTPNPVQ